MKLARLLFLLTFVLALIMTASVGTPTVVAETAKEQTTSAPDCNEWIGAPDIYVSPAYLEDNTLFAVGGRPANSGFSSRFLKSTDRGLTWQQMSLDPQTSIMSELAFSGTYKEDHTLCFANETAVVCSRDAGEMWSSVPSPNVGGWRRNLAVADSDTFFLGIVGGPPIYPGQGLYRSDDGGQTWANVFEPGVNSVAVSPRFHEDPLVLIAPAAYHYDGGIWRSGDGGATWEDSSAGLTRNLEASTFSIRISPDYARDQTVFVRSYDGLYKSTDRGRHWTRQPVFSTGPGVRWVQDYIISPRYGQDRTIWATGVLLGESATRISTDGGASWSELPPTPELKAAAPYCVTDSWCSVELFGSMYDQTIKLTHLYRSFDGGQTWQCLEDPALPPPPRAWLPLVAGPQTGN